MRKIGFFLIVGLYIGTLKFICDSVADHASQQTAQGYQVAMSLTAGHAVRYPDLQSGKYVVVAVIDKNVRQAEGTVVLRQIIPTGDINVLVEGLPSSMMSEGYIFSNDGT